MRVVRLWGGLGNTMLDYANYIQLKKMYPDEEIFLDNTWHDYTGYPFELERVFDLNEAVYLRKYIENKEGINFDGKINQLRFWERMGFSSWLDFRYHYVNSKNDYVTGNIGYDELAEIYKPYISDYKIISNGTITISEFLKKYNEGLDKTNIVRIKEKIKSATEWTELLFYYRLLSMSGVRKKFFDDLKHGRKPDFTPYETVDILRQEGDTYYNLHGGRYSIIGIRDELLEAYRFRKLPKGRIREYSSMIQQTEAVAVHARTLSFDYGMGGLLGRNYYNKAIRYIRKHVKKQPVFYVFSDNIEWCKKHMEYLGLDNSDKVVYVDSVKAAETGDNDASVDMQLISYCKHCVVPNSSYGWWGGYLIKNKDKIFITPYGTLPGTVSF